MFIFVNSYDVFVVCNVLVVKKVWFYEVYVKNYILCGFWFGVIWLIFDLIGEELVVWMVG